MVFYFLRLIRPQTLLISLCPIIVAASMVPSILSQKKHLFFLLLICALFIQIGTNLANDYFDYKKEADSKGRLGPDRFTQNQKISVHTLKLSFIMCFGLAFIIGLYLTYIGGWLIFGIGCLAILFGILYTATPYALAYTGTADLIAFLFFGPIAVSGSIYLFTQKIIPETMLAGSGLGCFSLALLAINNYRDFESDKAVNKKTLVVRFGKSFGALSFFLSLNFSAIVGILLFNRFQSPLFLSTLIMSILSVPFLILLRQTTGKALNKFLGLTVLLLFVYTVLLSLSFLLNRNPVV